MVNFGLVLVTFAALQLYSATPSPEQEDPAQQNVCENSESTLSKALGHLLGQGLQSLEIPLDIEALVQGLLDEASGIPSPLTEEASLAKLSALQEQSRSMQKQKNLQEAESFLEENGQKEGVFVRENGKLQFEILKTGSGAAIEPYHAPLVRYRAEFLHGPSLLEEPVEERIILEEAIPGLAIGLIGMKEGEIRKLYIHPEMGHPSSSHPQSLLIFEVEVLSASPTSKPLCDSEHSLISEEIDSRLLQ